MDYDIHRSAIYKTYCRVLKKDQQQNKEPLLNNWVKNNVTVSEMRQILTVRGFVAMDIGENIHYHNDHGRITRCRKNTKECISDIPIEIPFKQECKDGIIGWSWQG
jgi:hypothetical protein